MSRKKKVKPDDEEHYSLLIEFAKQLDDSDSEQRFEEATKRILAREKSNGANKFDNSKST
ncbi:MAG TPA: hypothetical protein VMC85_14595 [Desulfomonilaceae bacterium]|nr:hypothetical protein [Desulfomonilaceae bacterium]